MSKVLLVAPAATGPTSVKPGWLSSGPRSRGPPRPHRAQLPRSGPTAVAPQLPSPVVEWDQPEIFGRAARFNSLLKPWYPLSTASAGGGCARPRPQERSSRSPPTSAGRHALPVAAPRSGIPYVLGPVGGSLSSPTGFRRRHAPWYVGLRSIDSWRLRHDPLLRRSYQVPPACSPSAPNVLEQLEPLALRDVRSCRRRDPRGAPGHRSQRSGRHRPPALRRSSHPHQGRSGRDRGNGRSSATSTSGSTWWDGFDREACQDLRRSLGWETVSSSTVLCRTPGGAFYEAADVFVFPSFREPGGNVQFEAMEPMLSRWWSTTVAGRRTSSTTPVPCAWPRRRRSRTPVPWPPLSDHSSRTGDRRLAMGRAAHDLVSRSGTWQHRLDALETVPADARYCCGVLTPAVLGFDDDRSGGVPTCSTARRSHHPGSTRPPARSCPTG